MTARLAVCFGSFLLALLTSVTMAQAPKAGVLSAEDLKRVVPAAYFFRGQSASVQSAIRQDSAILVASWC